MLKTVLQVSLATIVCGVGITACDTADSPNVAESDPTESGADIAASSPSAPEEVVDRASKPASADEKVADAFRQSLDEIWLESDPFLQVERLAALLRTAGALGVPAAIEALEDDRLDLDAAKRELLVRYWATHQPESATHWTITSPAVHRIAAVTTSLSIWAEADPQTAAAAVGGWMPDSFLAKFLPIALIRGWYANGDLTGLEQYIQSFGKSFARQRSLATFIRVLIQAKGGEEAVRWAESLSDDDHGYKLDTYRQVSSVLPIYDFEAGMRWCDRHCDGPYGSGMRGLIGRRWATRDGAGAMEWLLTAPESRDHNLALRGSYLVWSQRNEEEALGWIRDQNAERLNPRLGPVFPVYVRLAAQDSPEDAIVFALRIEEPSERATALVLIVREWRKTDPDASDAWLLESPLAGADRERARLDSGNRRVPKAESAVEDES
jgi:hypothetical protein